MTATRLNKTNTIWAIVLEQFKRFSYKNKTKIVGLLCLQLYYFGVSVSTIMQLFIIFTIRTIMAFCAVCLAFCIYSNRSDNKIVLIDCIRRKALRKHAYSNTLKILPPKNGNFSDKKIWYFSCFCSKHRLWVLVRTASARRFQRVPTIYVFEQK